VFTIYKVKQNVILIYELKLTSVHLHAFIKFYSLMTRVVYVAYYGG